MILIFDLMDTLIEDPFYSNFFLKLQDRQKKIWLSIKDHTMYQLFEEGNILENEYIKRSYKVDPEKYNLPSIPKMKKMMFKQVNYLPGIYELFTMLINLKKDCNIKTILASNYSIWYHEIFKKKKALSSWFDYIFVSCEMGIRKPSIEFYQVIHKTINDFIEDKEVIIFFDDKQENLNPIKEYQLPWEVVLIENKLNSSNIILKEILKKVPTFSECGQMRGKSLLK